MSLAISASKQGMQASTGFRRRVSSAVGRGARRFGRRVIRGARGRLAPPRGRRRRRRGITGRELSGFRKVLRMIVRFEDLFPRLKRARSARRFGRRSLVGDGE